MLDGVTRHLGRVDLVEHLQIKLLEIHWVALADQMVH